MEERTAPSPSSPLGLSEPHRGELPHTSSESQRLRPCPRPVPRTELAEFTDANFADEVLNQTVPVIIDFWSQTCGPCKLMHPVVRRLAEAFGARAKVGRLNVFENPRTTEALEIKAIPYIMVVHEGDVVFELVGDRPFEDLQAQLLPFIP